MRNVPALPRRGGDWLPTPIAFSPYPPYSTPLGAQLRSSVPWGEGSLCPKWSLAASQSRLALPPPWDFLLSLLGFSQSTVLVHQFTLKESKFSLISSFWLLYFGDVAGS